MRPLVLAALVLVVEGAAAADYTILRRTSIDDAGFQEQTEYWGRKRLVVDDSVQRTIVDFATDRLTLVDKDARSYVEMPLDAVRRQLLVVGAVVDNLPPRAREMIGLGGKITLSPNGNSTTLAGREAKEYGVGGERVTGWVWLAESLDPTTILGDEAASWWRAGGPLRAGPLADVAQAISDGKLRGMPLWVTLIAGSESGTTHITSQVTSVREEPPPPDVGRVPEGYRKETTPVGP
jgi:hypothetical protein